MRLKTASIFILTAILISSQFLAFGQTSSSSANEKKSTYNLPYPGTLPDNPLYKLKVLRDKITLFLITSPSKKIDYYLLLTDKGISTTELLVKEKKFALAKETALKGENNYTLLTYLIRDKKWDIKKEQYQKVETAALKHQDVLKDIIKLTPKEDKKTFENVLYFSQQNLKEIKNAQETLNP